MPAISSNARRPIAPRASLSWRKLRRKMRSRGSAASKGILDARPLRLRDPRGPEPAAAARRSRRLRHRPDVATDRACLRGRMGEPRLSETGRTVGSAHVQLLARQANRHTPELRTHARFGNRVDEIEFHPAWHELMGLAIGQETHSLGWTEKRPGAQVARAALAYLWNEGE